MIAAMWFITIMLVSPILSWGNSKDPYRELWSSNAGRVDEPIIVGGNEIVPESDLRNPQRRIWIITTGVILCLLLFMTTALFLFTSTHFFFVLSPQLNPYHFYMIGFHSLPMNMFIMKNDLHLSYSNFFIHSMSSMAYWHFSQSSVTCCLSGKRQTKG